MPNFNSELGLRTGAEDATVTLDAGPQHQAAPGIIHFAVLATLAEVSAAHAAGGAVVPVNVSLSLLSPASPGVLEGRGRVLRRGRRLTVAEGEVNQNQKLVAKATVTFASI